MTEEGDSISSSAKVGTSRCDVPARASAGGIDADGRADRCAAERGADGAARRPCLAEAFRQRSVWARAALIGLPVGCLQALLNQGDVWWQHHANGLVLAKTILSPLVTFSVALVSCAATWVEKQQLIRNQSPVAGAHHFESSNGNPQTA
jgi:hypothetical protein